MTPHAQVQADRLKLAVALLRDIEADWDEDAVTNYPADLPSFDELVASLAAIEFGGAR